MANLARVKRNVSKMVSMKAPENEIDQYISSEGTSVEEVRDYSGGFGSQVKDIIGTALGKTVDQLTSPEARAERATYPIPTKAVSEFTGGFLPGLAYGASSGIPHQIAKEQFDVDIPKGGLGGQLAGYVAGPGKAAQLAAKRVPTTVGKSIVGGAVSGALMPGQSPQQRLASAGFWGAAGVPLGLTGKMFQTVAKAIGANRARALLLKQQAGTPLTKEARLPGVLNRLIARAKGQAGKEISAVKQGRDKISQTLSTELTEQSKRIAPEAQPKILNSIRSFKQSWGDSFDDALEKAYQVSKKSPAGQRTGITVGDLNEIEREVLGDLTNMGVDFKGKPFGVIRQVIRSLRGKPSKILDQYGKPIETSTQDFLDLRKVVNARREVNKALSTQAKGGSGYTVEDISATLFNKRLGERLELVVPELKSLNAEYKDFMNLSKFAYRTFKPYGGEYSTKTGEGLLRRVSTGKASGSEEAAVTALERGTRRLPGIGPVTKPMRLLADRIKTNKELAKTVITNKEASLSRKIATLERRKHLAIKNKTKLSVDVKNQLEKLNEQAKAVRVLKSMGKSAAATLGYVALYRLIHKAGFKEEEWGGGE